MITCPVCRSKSVYRSRRRGVIERTILTMAFVKPFRCQACESRFFRHSSLIPFGPGQHQRSNTAVRLLPVSRIIQRSKETVPYWTGALRNRVASLLIAWGKTKFLGL